MNAATMTTPLELRAELIERVAKYATMFVPNEQIGRATGLSTGQLAKVMALPEYTTVLEQISSEQLEQNDTLNRGWDAVEDQAVTIVLQTLQANPDPDYALRAATVANKAVRRGAGANPLQGNTSAVAHISLPVMFVQYLQQLSIGSVNVNLAAETKRVDTLSAGNVERMLQGPTREQLVDELFTEYSAA